MTSKYIDTSAIMQVVGNVFKNPQLLDLTDKYSINDEDFPDQFHKIVFGAIFKLHELGAQTITINSICDFLSTRPKSEAIFRQQKGEEWLLKVSENCTPNAFDYYYDRLKKFSLLRAYDSYGINITDIYDPDNLLDVKKQQLQEDKLDNMTLVQIADLVDKKIENIRLQYVDDIIDEASQAGEGIFDLIRSFKLNPEAGVPMYGPLINTVTRGARLGKLYLRSAPTGIGKTRTMVADTCYIGCNKIYDEIFGWIRTGPAQPILYIATEQDLSEIQTMMLAFLADVNEEHIIDGKYEGDEEERVATAAEILQNSPIYIEYLPDFSLQDVENKIKRNIRDHDIKYAVMDYIHTSMKILEEITRRSGGIRLREDNVLFMLSDKLKSLCNQYGVFILSSTQLNSDYQTSETPDQNLLRGAKSIADRIDLGMILLPVRMEDKKNLDPILSTGTFATPSLKLSVYKNRRGRYKGIYLWCSADLGTCRVKPLFATSWDYELIPIDDTRIQVASAFPDDEDED